MSMGTRHDPLTETEYEAQGSLDSRILTALEAHRRKLGLEPQQMRVLDYGCGRGRQVVWLREQGYEAYGVEVDSLPVDNGRPFLEARGIDPMALQLLDERSRSSFPDAFFHFVFSEQVFEHVSNLDDVTTELARITAPGGLGYHVYPPYRGVKEGHLFMPCVHWFPKNGIRKAVVRAYVSMGVEPHWRQLEGKGVDEKTEVYYRYSVDHTFYRRFNVVRDSFREKGFAVSSRVMTGPRWQRSAFYRALARSWAVRTFIQTFRKVELVAEMS